PGPLFSFAAYLGAISNFEPSGWLGALICLVAIFLPSFLLIVGIFPFWENPGVAMINPSIKRNDFICMCRCGVFKKKHVVYTIISNYFLSVFFDFICYIAFSKIENAHGIQKVSSRNRA
ncbi:MAG: hypothetical protein FGM46_06105, partial [Ferruginibacter sp.]|nr:hypothetical protein [Ferruginibacter sp.]